MTKPVIIQPEAEAQILEHGLWWLHHREKAPFLLSGSVMVSYAPAETPWQSHPWKSRSNLDLRVSLCRT